MAASHQNLADRIDEVVRLYPWPEICDAWSHPLWFPEALHALASDRPFRRMRARCQIYDQVVHQGTPCTGTGAVIVLLVNVAAIREMPDRTLLMRMAGEMLYVDEDRNVPLPFTLERTPLHWHSSLLGRRNVEMTWREVTRVVDLLQTLAQTEPIEIAWWAARILLLGHSRRPCFPLPDNRLWPRLSADVLRQLSAVVARSNANQLPTEADAAADYGLDHVRDPADSMIDVLLHGAPEMIPDIRKVTTLSDVRLYDFLESLELRTLAWSDEEFVTGLLDLIRNKSTDGAGEPLHDVLTLLLAHARVHCAEAVERLLAFALTHERASFRSAAARALTAPIDDPAEARVDALIRVLAEGDLAAKLGVLQSSLGCSTGTEWLVPWTPERDPERTYDLPHLRDRLLPAIIERVGDEHRAVRGAAIEALSVVSPDEPEAVARVIGRRSDSCPVVRRSVAHFCGSSRLQERTFRVLAESLSDADPEVRAEAVCRMGFATVTEHRMAECGRYAAQALDDPDPRVVAQAAFALHRQLDQPDNLFARQELARQLAASVTADGPAMNVIFKGTLISRLDASLAADGEALVRSVATRKPEWMDG